MEECEQESYYKGLYQSKKNPSRAVMIDFFFQYFNTNEVFFHAIEVYDLYVLHLKTIVSTPSLDIAKAIVWISIKFHDNDIAPDRSFLHLQRIERHILQTIDYTLHFPTIYTFIEALDLRDSFHHDLIIVLCYLSIYRISRYYMPSIIAQSAYILSCQYLHRSPLHILKLGNHSMIHNCMINLNKMYKALLQQKVLERDHFIIKTYALLDYVPAKK